MSKVTKNGKSKSANGSLEKQSYFDIFKFILLISTLLVVFITPYIRGLYFEPEQFVTQIILFSIFIVFWVYKWLRKDRIFLKTPIEYAGFALMLVYFLSSFTAVNQRLAVSEFLKYAMYFVVFLMLTDLIQSDREKSIVLWVIMASALGLCIIGFDSAAGGTIVDLLNNVFKAFRLDFEFFGLFVQGRIHSTMQYANAFASYLLAIFFVSMSLTLVSDKKIKSFSSAISFIILTTLIFTVSRGVYILLVFAIILFPNILPKERRLVGSYTLISVGIITIVFTLFLSKFIFEGASNNAYAWLLLILGATMCYFIRMTDDYAVRILSKINWKITVVATIALVAVSALVIGYTFNASVPLELRHSLNEEGYIGVSKKVTLPTNKKYKLIFDVDGKSSNSKATFVYKIYIRSRDEKALVTGKEVAIIEKLYNSTEGIEKKEIEFTVPKDSKLINIGFQNYYSGTSVKFHNAEIIDAESGKKIKDLTLKHKYAFAGSVLSRFENFTGDKSNITRISFIKDGLRILKDWWFIGAGGGAWAILNFKYQSFLYWSTQTHSYPLQVAVETGVVGLTILILLFGFIVISFIKLNKRSDLKNINGRVMNAGIFTAIVFLFIHAGIDFDFSLSSIYLTVWVLTALLNADVRKYLLSIKSEVKKKNTHKNALNFKLLISALKSKFELGFNTYPIIMIILTVFMMICPIIFYKAYIYSNKALDSYKENKIDEAIALMEKAANLDYLQTKYATGYAPISSRPDIRIGYIDLVINKLSNVSKQRNGGETNSQEKEDLNNYIAKAQKLAKKVEKYAKHDADLCLNLGIYYLNTTERDKGLDYINKSLDLKPFVPAQWNYKANANYALAISYLKQGNNEKGLKYIDNIIKIIEEAKEVNYSNMSPFVFSVETQEYLEKAYYIKNEIGTNIDNLIFQSIFEMDIDSDNIPDQWFVNDINALELDLKNGILNVNINDLSKETYLYTRDIVIEPEKEYLIEVELLDPKDTKSIPVSIRGVSNKIDLLNQKNNVFSGKIISPTKIQDKNQLRIYIEDNYSIKSVRIISLN